MDIVLPIHLVTMSRAWCFTEFDLERDLPTLDTWSDLRYLVYQYELCPATYNVHIQGYLELRSPQRMSCLKHYFSPTAHLEPRKGTRDQARDYCMKLQSRLEGPFEEGEWKAGGQGARVDLLQAAQIVKTKGLQALVEEKPDLLVRYSRGFQLLSQMTTAPRGQLTNSTIYWGVPGSGKSLRAYCENPFAYWKPPDTKWWDGYQQQETVVWDDFSPDQIPLQSLLRLLDRYPLQVEVKGGHTQFTASKLVFTSNTDPYTWYSGHKNRGAFLRRLEESTVEEITL